ncbi:MAG: hypothetical protein VX012_07125 [Planctomycetota bacterium]|nr:hypothetical protein [Planctomycetota bacterium]
MTHPGRSVGEHDRMANLVLLSQLAVTWFLAGLIWTIQVVHYPLFAAVGEDRFVAYETSHARLITLVVGPAMLLEVALAGLFLTIRPAAVPAWVAWVGAGLVGIIWLSTALIQVPAHGRLADGFDASTHALLVGSNWIRTLAWSARALLLAWAAWLVIAGATGGRDLP